VPARIGNISAGGAGCCWEVTSSDRRDAELGLGLPKSYPDKELWRGRAENSSEIGRKAVRSDASQQEAQDSNLFARDQGR